MSPSISQIRAVAEKDSHHAIHLLPKTVIEMCERIEYLDKLACDAISTNERQAMMLGEQEKVIEMLRRENDRLFWLARETCDEALLAHAKLESK